MRLAFIFLTGILTAIPPAGAQGPVPLPVPVPSPVQPGGPPGPYPQPVPPPAPPKKRTPKPAPRPEPAKEQPPPPPPVPTDLAPERKEFIRPKVPAALFTHDKTALLEVECERIAAFLARYAAEKYTAAILAGEREAMSQGRLLLAVSLHLAPLNAGAVRCGDQWVDGKSPALPPSGEDLRVFSDFLLAAAQRQQGKPGTSREVLARVLIRLAADLDPKNEEAVYVSEMQDRDGKAPPWREILEGTLTVQQ